MFLIRFIIVVVEHVLDFNYSQHQLNVIRKLFDLLLMLITRRTFDKQMMKKNH